MCALATLKLRINISELIEQTFLNKLRSFIRLKAAVGIDSSERVRAERNILKMWRIWSGVKVEAFNEKRSLTLLPFCMDQLWMQINANSSLKTTWSLYFLLTVEFYFEIIESSVISLILTLWRYTKRLWMSSKVSRKTDYNSFEIWNCVKEKSHKSPRTLIQDTFLLYQSFRLKARNIVFKKKSVEWKKLKLKKIVLGENKILKIHVFVSHLMKVNLFFRQPQIFFYVSNALINLVFFA